MLPPVSLPWGKPKHWVTHDGLRNGFPVLLDPRLKFDILLILTKLKKTCVFFCAKCHQQSKENKSVEEIISLTSQPNK
jgi:hypothetical protein